MTAPPMMRDTSKPDASSMSRLGTGPLSGRTLVHRRPSTTSTQSTTTDTLDFPAYLTSVLTPWPYQVEAAARWDTGADEIILKARQIGVSELATVYAAYRAERGHTALVLSSGQREARMFLRRCRDVLMKRGSVGALDNADELSSKQGGRVVALPATRDAGRSFTAHLVIVDEAAFHPWASDNYAAYRPTMADGGQLLIVSTANGASGWYYDTWQGAVSAEARYRALNPDDKQLSGYTGLRPVFLPWSSRPGRDEAWLSHEREAYAGLAAAFAQEYPSTPADAFVAHSGLVYGLDADGMAIYERGRNIRPAAATWAACKHRVVGIDPGGDGDPTALVALGVDDRDRLHVYGLRVIRGSGDIVQWHDWIASVNEAAPVGKVFVGETGGSTLVATLQRMGWAASKAVMDRSRIGMMQGLLKAGRLTLEPSSRDAFERELHSYYWAKDMDGSRKAQQWATETGGGHHADLLDALRYAAISAIDNPPAAGRQVARSGYLKSREYLEGRR